MKHLATVAYFDNWQVTRNLFEEDNQCFDNHSEENLTREQVREVINTLHKYVDNLEKYLERTCGAHPTLVALKQEGFEEPECDGGWSFAAEPVVRLGQDYGEVWTLYVECRYEHHDDRGGQFTQNGQFQVVDGKLFDAYNQETVCENAEDLEACKKAVSEWFYTDGG